MSEVVIDGVRYVPVVEKPKRPVLVFTGVDRYTSTRSLSVDDLADGTCRFMITDRTSTMCATLTDTQVFDMARAIVDRKYGGDHPKNPPEVRPFDN